VCGEEAPVTSTLDNLSSWLRQSEIDEFLDRRDTVRNIERPASPEKFLNIFLSVTHGIQCNSARIRCLEVTLLCLYKGCISRTDRLTAFKDISENTGREGRNIGCMWPSMWNRQADRCMSFHRLLRPNHDSFDGVSIGNWYDICIEAINGFLN
jgi:hypothetical protein